MNHYWVVTIDLDPNGHEPAILYDQIQAENKTKAKGAFVSRNRQDIEREIGGDNPFAIIDKVEDFMCEHGVCNCENIADCDRGLPRNPDYDMCGACFRQAEAEEAIKALGDFMAGRNVADASWRWENAVTELLRSVPDAPAAGAK